MNFKKTLYWLPVLAIMITVFYFSSQDATTSSETSSGFSEFLAEIISPDYESKSKAYQKELLENCQFVVRKSAHFSIYALMGFLSFNAFRQHKRVPKKQLLAAVLCMLYSVSDEIHQTFVPGRSCELRDIVIDTCGAVTGILFLSLLLFLYNKYKTKIKSVKEKTT